MSGLLVCVVLSFFTERMSSSQFILIGIRSCAEHQLAAELLFKLAHASRWNSLELKNFENELIYARRMPSVVKILLQILVDLQKEKQFMFEDKPNEMKDMRKTTCLKTMYVLVGFKLERPHISKTITREIKNPSHLINLKNNKFYQISKKKKLRVLTVCFYTF